MFDVGWPHQLSARSTGAKTMTKFFSGNVSNVLKRPLQGLLMLALMGGTTACSHLDLQKVTAREAPVVLGPPVRTNRTPLEGAFACMARAINAHNATGVAPIGIGVGDIKDYTGKYSQDEGSTITQGGSLMVYSALGKLDGAIQIQERFDTRIGELELAYIDRRQLGDGNVHMVDGQSQVPWMPYFGGTILRSDYYIVGGITEVNYNIQTGGAEFTIGGIGPQARIYTMNIGVDLRIVNSQTLLVAKTVSLQKQITGFEVGFDIFRFFGDTLYDVNIGNKSQEPLQLAVRSVLEQGVIELVSAVSRVDYRPCAGGEHLTISTQSADELMLVEPGVTPVAGVTAPAGNTGAGAVAGAVPLQGQVNTAGDARVAFEFGSNAMEAASGTAVTRIVEQIAAGNAMDVTLVARDSETYAPVRRDELTAERLRVFTDALAARGVNPAQVNVTWRPSPNDLGIVRDGAGYQEIARVRVSVP